MKVIHFTLCLFWSAALHAEDDPRRLLATMTKQPWPGVNYPALPALSESMTRNIGNEIHGRPVLIEAIRQLDPARSNNDWFDAVAILEREKAAWSLQACLCHPSEDVQIHALRSLQKLGDPAAVPFLLIYADYMAVMEGGSENATIHGIIHMSVAATLSTLTGISVQIDHQDPEALRKAIRQWTRWQLSQPE